MKRILALTALLLVTAMAHAQAPSVTLVWQPGTGSSDTNPIASYTPMRSAASTGPFTALATVQASPFIDTTVAAGGVYYYEVIATDSVGNVSAPSSIVMATIPGGTVTPPPPPPTSSVFDRYGTTASYTDPSGNVWKSATCPGSTSSTSHAINGTTTQPLYQYECYGKTFTLTISGLTANSAYTLTGKFAEFYWSSAGSRVFSVTENGVAWLTNFDIFASAGGEYIAIDKTATVTATSAGTVVLAFTTTTDNAKIDALSLVPAGPPPPPQSLGITCAWPQCTFSETNVPAGNATVTISIGSASANTTVAVP